MPVEDIYPAETGTQTACDALVALAEAGQHPDRQSPRLRAAG
ncbi:hypothetical protein [Magnetospirillum fulvum]|nr:hypothetical protein [Magnetospirillum fulvum]